MEINSFVMLKKGVSVFLLIILSTIVFAQDLSFTIDENGVRKFHDGSLMIKEDVPFLTVKGNPYEAGLQYGVLLNDYLVKMNHIVDSMIIENTGGFFVKKWIVNSVLSKKIKQIEKKMPDEYLLEMKGIADGSELKLKELQVIAYIPQLFFKISCTAFILKNENGIVHGRNLDWPGIEVLTHFPLIVNYHITDKIPFTNLTFIGYPGVYTGMNHSGLSLSINMNSAPAENGKKISDYNTGMPLAYKMRNILENAQNLSQVEEHFKNYSSHAWFITAGSKNDNTGAIYELTRGELIKNSMNDDFLFVENLSISDKGRYQYSPVWMFGMFNIARERKIKELNEKFGNVDLIDKSYNILSNTGNHHLMHDPFYGYCINNYNTIKSCILDNANNEIYFTYGEHNSALNKYLHYKIGKNEVAIFKAKQEIIDSKYHSAGIEYNNWYSKTYGRKKKLTEKDYRLINNEIQKYNLQPAYKAYLLSTNYLKRKDYENAYIQAENYISEAPDFYPAYYHKYRVVLEKGDYLKAIVTLEEMLQTSTINPYFEYRAKVNMIEMYDKLLQNKKDEIYIEKMHKLYAHIKSDIIQYFVDEETQKDLNLIENIIKKYK